MCSRAARLNHKRPVEEPEKQREVWGAAVLFMTWCATLRDMCALMQTCGARVGCKRASDQSGRRPGKGSCAYQAVHVKERQPRNKRGEPLL